MMLPPIDDEAPDSEPDRIYDDVVTRDAADGSDDYDEQLC